MRVHDALAHRHRHLTQVDQPTKVHQGTAKLCECCVSIYSKLYSSQSDGIGRASMPCVYNVPIPTTIIQQQVTL